MSILKIYWKPGKNNNVDYITKQHSTSHHQAMRLVYLIKETLLPYYFQMLSQACKGVKFQKVTLAIQYRNTYWLSKSLVEMQTSKQQC